MQTFHRLTPLRTRVSAIHARRRFVELFDGLPRQRRLDLLREAMPSDAWDQKMQQLKDELNSITNHYEPEPRPPATYAPAPRFEME